MTCCFSSSMSNVITRVVSFYFLTQLYFFCFPVCLGFIRLNRPKKWTCLNLLFFSRRSARSGCNLRHKSNCIRQEKIIKKMRYMRFRKSLWALQPLKILTSSLLVDLLEHYAILFQLTSILLFKYQNIG